MNDLAGFIKKILFLFIATSLLSSCLLSRGLHVGDVEDVEINDISLKKINIMLELPIENPGILNLKLKELEMDLFLNDMKIGEAHNSKEVIIHRRSEEVYSFPLDVEMKGLASSLMGLMMLSGKSDVSYRIKGEMKVRYFFFNKTYDFDETGYVDL